MLPEDLAAVEALCAKADDGPWEAEDIGRNMGGWTLNTAPTSDSSPGWLADFGMGNEHNARFCAGARMALPALVAEVARLQQMVLALWVLEQVSEGRVVRILAVPRVVAREMREAAFPDWDRKRAIEVLNGREGSDGGD